MKSWKKLALAVSVSVGVAALAWAFSVPSSVLQYFGSGAGSTTSIFNLDGNGNVTITGGLTVNGKTASTVDGSYGNNGVTPITFNTPVALWSQTATQIAALIPSGAGQEVFCSNCGAVNSGLGSECISTGTVVGSFIISGSSLTAVTVCK